MPDPTLLTQEQLEALKRDCMAASNDQPSLARVGHVRQLIDEIERLQSKVAHLQDWMSVLVSSRDMILHTFVLWQTDYQAGKMALREIGPLREEIERLTSELTYQDQQTKTALTMIEQLTQDRDTWKARCEQLEMDLDKHKDALSKTFITVVETTIKIEQLEATVAGLREQLSVIARTQSFEETCAQLASAKQQLAACQADLDEARKYDVRTIPIADSGTSSASSNIKAVHISNSTLTPQQIEVGQAVAKKHSLLDESTP